MADIEVLADDQKRINRFGNLNTQVTALEMELKKLKKQQQDFQDASEEVELLDGEADFIPFKIGTAFIELPYDDAAEELQVEAAEIDKRIDVLNAMIQEKKNEMDTLRQVLYGKFGRENINLG